MTIGILKTSQNPLDKLKKRMVVKLKTSVFLSSLRADVLEIPDMLYVVVCCDKSYMDHIFFSHKAVIEHCLV